MAHWIFQANPKYYDVTRAIADLDEMDWLVTRYGAEIAPGDDVLLWMSGKQAGIYAKAVVTMRARKVDVHEDTPYWREIPARLKVTPQCRIRFMRRLVDRPILRSDLLEDPALKDLSVIRVPNGTNFRVTPEQWQRLQQLLA